MRATSYFGVLAALGIGCGGDESQRGDATSVDTGADSATGDTGAADSAPADTAPADTAEEESAEEDTATADTVGDTSPADTTAGDSAGETGGSDIAVAPPYEPLPPIEVVREFACAPSALGAIGDIAPVSGLDGATLAIRPGAEPCRFELVLRRAAGDPVSLSGAAHGGYLLAVAGRAASGRVVACASNIEHVADAAGGDASDTEAVPRRIERVAIECTVGDGTSFAPLSEVVAPDGAWAAWALGLEQSDQTPNRYRLVWIRDFSFQFANLNNNGRPPEDGIYATTFDVADDGGWTVVGRERVSDVIAPGDVVQREWEPTDEEREAYAEFIDFEEGTCGPPAGCELPPEEP